MKEVQGVKFALNDKENRITDRIDQASPPASAPADRCAYWKHNLATGRHTFASPSVMAWVEAKTNEACAGETASRSRGSRGAGGPKSCSDQCLPVMTNAATYKACLSNCKDEKAQAQSPANPPSTDPSNSVTASTDAEPPPQVPSDPAQLLSLLSSSRPFNGNSIDLHAIAVFVTAYAAFAKNPEVSNAASHVMAAIRTAKGALKLPSDTIMMAPIVDANDTSGLRLISRSPLPLVIALYSAVNGAGTLYQQFISEQRNRLAPNVLSEMQQQMSSNNGPWSVNIADLQQLQEDLEKEARYGR